MCCFGVTKPKTAGSFGRGWVFFKGFSFAHADFPSLMLHQIAIFVSKMPGDDTRNSGEVNNMASNLFNSPDHKWVATFSSRAKLGRQTFLDTSGVY